jgi:hypothetical protein
MSSDSPYDDQVRLYALANTTSFVEQSENIKRLVFQALRVSPSERRRVNISPGSGWLEYTALDEVWNRRSPPALPDKPEAQKAAEDLLNRLEQLCSDANSAWPTTLRGKALLPPVNLLRRSSLQAIPRPDGSAFDHWLYRAQPQLMLDGGSKTRAPVFGAQVEVRIGHMAQPISVRSRWTPLAAEPKLTPLSPYQPAPDDEGDNTNSNEPILAFLLEGAGVPQFYLAPYYFRIDEHGATAVSASRFSLTVDIANAKQDERRTTVTALARGGSGDYLYTWAAYSYNRIHDGLRLIGSGRQEAVKSREGPAVTSSIELDNGAYIVLLNAKDRATGAFKHQQSQIFSGPILKTEEDDSSPQLIA